MLRESPTGFVEFSHHSKSIGVKYTETGIQMFFNTFTLVLFMSYQALCFCMCFYRLVHAMVDQRRIDVTAQGNDNERHLFHGTAWLALGIKLGAVETVVGFATGDFGLSLTRRILRFVGRACLIIGVIKGSVISRLWRPKSHLQCILALMQLSTSNL